MLQTIWEDDIFDTRYAPIHSFFVLAHTEYLGYVFLNSTDILHGVRVWDTFFPVRVLRTVVEDDT